MISRVKTNFQNRKRKLQCLVALVVGVVCSGFSAFADENWNIEILMEKLSKVEYAKLDFVETKQSIFLFTDTTLEGIMEYRAPSYIEKNTLSPYKERVTIDGDSMVIEKIPAAGQQQDVTIVQRISVESHPVLNAAVKSIRAMLAGNYEVLSETYTLSLVGDQAQWKLVLIPKTKEILEYIESIILTGEDIKVKNIVTIQADGDESTLELSYKHLE
jgi:outer membrane lipoprotein-sorting protein